MTLDEICALPVAKAAAEPSHLYLWTPNALLPDALTVMKAWGFEYKSNIIWHKVRKDGGSDGRGVGFYFRNVTELLLFGVRGKNARTLQPGRSQVNLMATRKREHSRKPDEQYELIESCSPGPYLEVFARGHRPGWQVWGTLAEALSSYFSAIRGANEVRWAAGKASHLCTNTGVEAYIRLFGELCRFVQQDTGMDPRELHVDELVTQVIRYLGPALNVVAGASDDEFSENFKVAFGSGGPAAYFYRLCVMIRGEFPAFAPDGLDDHLRETDDDRRAKADGQVRQIQSKVPEFVIARLKEIYPGQHYLDRAVKNQEILVEAFKKRTQTPIEDQDELETYLDFLDFRKIVEAKENWPHFSDYLSIPLADERPGQAKYVKWFDEINRIRRIPAHPFGKRYKDEDISTLDYVYQRLQDRNIV
jgi:N6-adenosine-specific RNA methylase IME4